jgi:hypothetical protein
MAATSPSATAKSASSWPSKGTPQRRFKGREIIAPLKEHFPETTYADDLVWFDAEIAKLQPAAQPTQAVE